MKEIPLSEVKDDLSGDLHLAEGEEIVITRHGKPAGILLGRGSGRKSKVAASDERFVEMCRATFDFRPAPPPFLARIDEARAGIHAGQGIR